MILIIETAKNGRLSSPLRTLTANIRSTTPANLSPLRSTIAAIHISENNTNTSSDLVKSRDVSREREKTPPMDYTDLEGKFMNIFILNLSSFV